MSFASVLDAYCNALGCTNKEIAQTCGISPSALSRYRRGDRAPEMGSEVVERLVAGLVELTDARNSDRQWRESSIRSALERGLSGSRLFGMDFGARVDALMSLLDLRNADIARALDVSPSYISRIRSGQRMPADQRRFAVRLSRHAAVRCSECNKVSELMALVDSADEFIAKSQYDLDSQADLAEVIELWLLGSNIVESDLAAVEGLLEKLNGFYFNNALDRIRALVPIQSIPCHPDSFSHFYHGFDDMKEAEVSFFEIAAAHDSREVYLSSDMPFLEMALEPDFAERYQLLIGTLIRKGCHITAIHNAERPLAETVIALDLWLPLYLTGNVTPCYLKGVSNRLFCHVNYVCDLCALSAEAVMGHQTEGRYYLTTQPDDVAYYQQKMGFIMEHVSSMLEIYRDDEPEYLERISQLDSAQRGKAQAARHVVGAGRYENLRIVSYPGKCAVVTILCEPAIHLIIRHPKLRYVIAHMQ